MSISSPRAKRRPGNSIAGGPAAPCAHEDLARLALERADLGKDLLDLFALALELLAAGGERCDELLQLRPLVGRRIVEFQHLVHLGEGEPEALPAQYQLEAHPVSLGIDAPRAVAPRAEQAFILVEADGSMGYVELARKIGDAVGFGVLVHRRNAERFRTVCGGRRHNLREFAPFAAGSFGFYSDLLAPSKARDP